LFTTIQVITLILLALSLTANVALFLAHKSRGSDLQALNEKLSETTQQLSEAQAALTRSKNYDADALHSDLARYNHALIKVTRIDPEDVLIRSPRDRR
jgi:hypothetical protein